MGSDVGVGNILWRFDGGAEVGKALAPMNLEFGWHNNPCVFVMVQF